MKRGKSRPVFLPVYTCRHEYLGEGCCPTCAEEQKKAREEQVVERLEEELTGETNG